MAIAQGTPGSATAAVGGSATWLGDLRGLLGDSFGMYLTYENMRRGAGTTADVKDKQMTAELANGAATVYQTTGVQPGQAVQGQVAQHFNIMGMAVPKPVAYIGAALLAVLVAKKAGVL